MAALDDLVAASKTFISNPFLDETAYVRAQSQLRTARRDVAAAVEQLVASDRKSDAKRVVVAFMTLARFDTPLGTPAPLPQLDEKAFRTLGLERSTTQRIAAAGFRSHTQLRRFVGESASAMTVRAEVWAATFGKSLYDAWKNRNALRRHDVLLRGETGTGKEVLARAIQLGSFAETGDEPDADPPMAEINAAAISRDLLESELFGHVKGAFSDARADRAGLFEAAQGGTVFLDEVADLHASHQPKLLRVLEERRVARVGSDHARDIDVRIIAATSRPLENLIKTDRFREDLYQRLNASEIHIPPLRDRRADVEAIARSVAEGIQSVHTQPNDPNLQQLLGHLKDYHWPGNVRELVKMVKSHVLSMPGPKIAADTDVNMPEDLREFIERVRRLELTLEEVELTYMRLVLKAENNNKERASRRLGINRGTLANRLEPKD